MLEGVSDVVFPQETVHVPGCKELVELARGTRPDGAEIVAEPVDREQVGRGD